MPAAAGQDPAAPPNAAALVRTTGGRVALTYRGSLLLDATVASTGAPPDFRAVIDNAGGRVTQILKWTATRGTRLTLSGTVHASPEAFAAEVEPRDNALPLVRHAVGPVSNPLNRAVYDRRFDWVLSVDFPASAGIVPEVSSGTAAAFRVDAKGGEVAIRFRPRYYQRHRALAEYRPWTYRPWEHSVAGWTSWYAFFDKVTERDVQRTADVLGEVLRPFGYRYLQIDDGYQRLPIGMPANWLETNDKFPGGLAALRRYISDRGLEPGIWTNVSFQQTDQAESHARWFVRTPEGRPAHGNWVGFVMDGSQAGAIANLVTPVYRALADMGWSYFKLDALRHLRYEGYNSFAAYFTRKGLDRAQVFRRVVSAVRDVIGRDRYLLACWGIRPELIGLVDGVRVGNDGFGYGSFAQYNSFNNVVWRNDPDHIELGRPDGYRAATLTSLTGSVLMLTDPPEVYRTERVEAARRTAPVLFTRPGQIYDVDPSRSSRLGEVGAQLSGAGPRSFDADQRLVVPLYQLDIARPFEQWTVLARAGGDGEIALADLGLRRGTDYLAFEFWTHTALGIARDHLTLPPVDPGYQVQVVCLRARVDRPQVLSTSRHVSCGGPDLLDVRWADDTLSGTSELVPADPYAVFLTEPAGFRLEDVRTDGAAVVVQSMEGDTRVIRLLSPRGGPARWTARYARIH
ncbi:MAG: hypothetical protein A3H96_01330 [Acidobacteria bacterium RIFCSPLOWO2_02_FULL_67_36]|nr:MAG: hypothetical protein A3H96_01330 [Acidobacteria bacterium RIFCSPLOWO2_02_FULL_67_36]OFW18691.1 MAG: hypothetical protein A3G21_25810 [Acidobacteria bacterium RIFCSPLOWO2_12_FULL_66_21]